MRRPGKTESVLALLVAGAAACRVAPPPPVSEPEHGALARAMTEVVRAVRPLVVERLGVEPVARIVVGVHELEREEDAKTLATTAPIAPGEWGIVFDPLLELQHPATRRALAVHELCHVHLETDALWRTLPAALHEGMCEALADELVPLGAAERALTRPAESARALAAIRAATDVRGMRRRLLEARALDVVPTQDWLLEPRGEGDGAPASHAAADDGL